MGEESKDFKSFADLRKALGGGEEPPDEVKPEVAANDEAEDDGLPERAYARELIDAMGTSFGAMETGPACYRDADSEEMELLATFRVRTVFPESVVAEAAQLPTDPSEADCAAREDLRGATIFTIDGEDAKDFDDAISIEDHPDGGVEVGVHIADVSHYVVPGTYLDAEALARATSVYLADQVIPMLPEALSNTLCSLMPHRNRLAFSVFMHFGDDGARRGVRIHKSVIRSVHRCTYRGVQNLLDGVDDDSVRAMAAIAPRLRAFAAWTKRQQQLRDARGSLRLQSGERKFGFNAEHQVERIYRADTFFSQALIEETALAANQAVGDFFNDRRMPAIYRIHPEKDAKELAATIANLAKYGIRVPQKERLTGRDIGRLILQARRRPNPEATIARIMSLMERAVYELVPPGGEAPHYGLARQHYLHFTSPIRRYPDLMVHRWLHELQSRDALAELELLEADKMLDLVDVAAHASAQADMASLVEVAVGDLKVCQYMHAFVGQKVMAMIERVSPWGLDLLLHEQFVHLFLPARSMDGRKQVDGPRMRVTSRKGNRVFDEGERLSVVITAVDFVRLQVVVDLAPQTRGMSTQQK